VLRVVYEQPRLMILWAEEQIGLEPFSAYANAIGVKRDDELAAVAVFDRFTSWGCEFSIASDGSRRWLTREFMRHCAAYAFGQLGLERVTSFVNAGNKTSVALCRHLGMVEEGRQRRVGIENDVLMFGLMRHECRWAPPLQFLRSRA
jgi:RimJ/RimL family protein N-acetyltransferase